VEAEDRPTGQHVKTKIELRQEKTGGKGIQNTDGWTKMHQPIKNGKECIKKSHAHKTPFFACCRCCLIDWRSATPETRDFVHRKTRNTGKRKEKNEKKRKGGDREQG
jgi:hypothetical protein